jgi:16S rRNA G966 N2-methylase RsmD
MACKIVHADSDTYSASADLIFTDPPYQMPGELLARIISRYKADHLILITTMSQLLEFVKYSEYELAFDFVIDAIVPKKSKSIHQPNYTHQTGVYLKKLGVPSVFNRKLRQRSDTFDNNGYWPTVLRAPRNNMHEHGMAKNLTAITDILGCFDVMSVIDMFGGSGTTALAAWDLGIDCIIIEKDTSAVEAMKKTLKFIGASVEAA